MVEKKLTKEVLAVQDRRPNQPINLSTVSTNDEIELYTCELRLLGDETKINKSDLKSIIADKYKVSANKIIIRFSTNYASDRVKKNKPNSYVSDRKWQGWHSIDFVGDLEPDRGVYYVFVIPNKDTLQIIIFKPDSFKKLITKKKEQESFTDYINAQGKECRKFNFYFADIPDDRKEEEKIPILPNKKLTMSIRIKIWIKRKLINIRKKCLILNKEKK